MENKTNYIKVINVVYPFHPRRGESNSKEAKSKKMGSWLFRICFGKLNLFTRSQNANHAYILDQL